jgi:hypothetical protein
VPQQAKNRATSSSKGLLPRARLGKFALDVYPAHQGSGFDLVLIFMGGSVIVENVRIAQVRRLLRSLEDFDH